MSPTGKELLLVIAKDFGHFQPMPENCLPENRRGKCSRFEPYCRDNITPNDGLT
jgi:hypothetical protein